MTYQRFNKKDTGFTLVEMLVVITIFSILMIAIVGVFVSVLRIQRYYLASQRLLSETSYIMEYTSRFIRMAQKDSDGTCINAGTNYYPDSSVLSDSLEFLNYRNQCHKFYRGNEAGVPDMNGKYFYQDINNGAEVLSLTSDKIEIKELNFYILGGDDLQPRVTIYLELEAIGSNPRPNIKIQTTISQRELDID